MGKTALYLSAERLYAYGEWYYLKYLPSNGRLKRILYHKSGGDGGLVEEAYRKLEPLFREDAILENLTFAMTEAGKSVQYIRNNLLKKEFDGEAVEAALKRHGNDWGKAEPRIRRKAEALLEKYTKKQTEYRLCGEYSEFVREIRALLQEQSDTDGGLLEKEWERLQTRYNAEKPKERAKMVQTLLRKGFLYDDIKGLLR